MLYINLLTICYLTNQTYTYSNKNNISTRLRYSSCNLQSIDMLSTQLAYRYRLILILMITIIYNEGYIK
jgi:hypothetical protein